MNLSRHQTETLSRVMATLAEPHGEREVRLQLGAQLLQLFGAQHYASYVWDDAHARFGDAVYLHMEAANLARYEAHYQFHDPITLRMQAHRRAVRATDVLPQPALKRTEFFNDFLARDGLHWGINLFAWDGERNIGDLRIWRDRRRENFSDDDRALLDLLRPAFVTALRRAAHEPAAPVAAPATAERTADSAAAGLLSPREHAVARLAADGLPDKAIAERLGISVTTVRTHLAHAFDKLAVGNRVALARRMLG